MVADHRELAAKTNRPWRHLSDLERSSKGKPMRRRQARDSKMVADTHTPSSSPECYRDPALASPVPASHRPRLVIADDDPVVQLFLSISLEDEFEVVGLAADGREAIELVEASQPDAALVDVVMPNGGGVRAARGILKVAPDTAIVMLSGQKCNRAVRQLLQAGAIVYRRKGTDPHALGVALTQSIQAHTAERRESAWKILSWYCTSLDRQSRSQTRTSYSYRQ
jgi:DNA-binding NarL/FixJ family response regulator